MVSMARQVLFLSSLWLVLVACQQVNQVTTPFVRAEANNTAFSHNQGVLLYENKPFWELSIYFLLIKIPQKLQLI